MITKNFSGIKLRIPSGSGPIDKICPVCGKKEGMYAIYGYNEGLGKPIYREFHITKEGCSHYEDNLTDEERKLFEAQFK